MSSDNRCRVLFLAEGATLAHVARPYLLAANLDPERYSVVFARPASYSWLTRTATFRVVDLDCLDSNIFLARLNSGAPLYTFAELEGYVAQDLSLIDAEHPDVVVGDFRISLAVSARLRGVPYLTVCDAYWSPEYPQELPYPVSKYSRYVPEAWGKSVFRVITPFLLRLHAQPMDRLRARYGFPVVGADLRAVYTDADFRLFANFPALFVGLQTGLKSDFIGPIAWSPPDQDDLEYPEGEGPLAYVTMGSSGDAEVLARLVPLLEEFGLRVMVAAAGRALPDLSTRRTRVRDFLPGDQLCRQSHLVVCNGGSPTTNQALMNGVPVVGLPHNMDQILNMQAIEAYGAGSAIRADRADRPSLRKVLADVLASARYARYRERAESLRSQAKLADLGQFIDRFWNSSKPSA